MPLLVLGENVAELKTTPLTPDGRRYTLSDNVHIHPNLEYIDLEGLELNPVIEPVQGLGRVTLEAVRHTTDPSGNGQKQVHRLYGIELNGFKQAAEITDPIDGEADYVIASLPGLSEHIQSRIRRSIHSNIVGQHPHARVVSIQTDGVGGVGDHYDAGQESERHKHSHTAMALNRLALTKALGGNRPQTIVGTSHGAVISHRMTMENTFGDPVNGPINLRGLVWVSPALVDPSRARKVMNDRFAAKFILDVTEELFLRSSPSEVYDAVLSLGALMIAWQDIGALKYQISQLRKGTPEEDVNKVVEAVPTIVIEGSDDAVAETDMYDRLLANPKTMLHVIRIPSRGHELAMKPSKLMNKLGNTQQYCQLFMDSAADSEKTAA